MILQEYLGRLSSSIEGIGEILTKFVGVFLGFEPWLESNVLYVAAAIVCYFLVAKLVWAWLKNLPDRVSAWTADAGENLYMLKVCSWSEPISSMIKLLVFMGFVLGSLGRLAFFCAGIGFFGIILYRWFIDIVLA